MPRKKKEPTLTEPTSKIIYGYVKSFLYHDNNSLYQMGGHPTPGRVYRIIKDSDKAYRLHIGTENNVAHHEGLLLNGLVGSWPNWECEIVEITPENFTEFDLTTEDSEKLNMWIETNNSDLTPHTKPGNVRTHLPSDIIRLLENLPKISPVTHLDSPADIHEGMQLLISDEAIHFGTIADNIREKDPDMLKALVHLLLYVGSCYGDKYEKGGMHNFSKEVTQHPDLGKGANLFTTLKYLQRYISTGFAKSGNPEDLMKSMHYILFELMRTKPWLKA